MKMVVLSCISYLFLMALTVIIFEEAFAQRTGDLRLYPSSSSSSSSTTGGRLEMYYSGWIPFTITGFDLHEADVACKTLGYSYATRYATVSTLGYSRSSVSYSVYRVNCPTSATSFSSCSYSRVYSYSRHYYDVGLKCTRSKSTLRLVSSSGHTSGVSSGRLEIFVNNTWGTVCDDNFGPTEATVACKQLRFSRYSEYTSAFSTVGYVTSLSGPIWLDNLSCTSLTSDLRKCTNVVGNHDCSHSEDVILTCNSGYVTTISTPYHHSTSSYVTTKSTPYHYTTSISVTASKPPRGSVRLVSSNEYTDTYLSKGRLEVFTYELSGYNWITFCSSSFSSHFADLACKQLGYNRASDFGKVNAFGYDQGSGSKSITYVTCPSHATTLDSCSFSLSSSCSHANDVAISCTYDMLTVSSGLIIGLTIGSLFFCFLMLLGGGLCAAVIGVVYRKKNVRSPRTNIVESQLQNPVTTGSFRMSDLAARENDYKMAHGCQSSVVHHAPRAAIPVTLQQAHMQTQNDNFKPQNEVGAAAEIGIEDDANDSYASDDEKPLINS